jgi:iron complex transport system substrate-binding protein
MKKTTIAVTAIILVLIIVVSSYGVYRFYVPSEPASQKETVTIVDQDGVSVEVKVPVKRIVSIIGTEIVYLLGGGDRIVGRSQLSTDIEAVLPSSFLEIPIVAESSFDVNLEMLLELEPDLVLADQGLSNEIKQKIEAAGVPVIIDMLMAPRRNIFIQNLGLILGAEEKANEFIDYEMYYEDLVKERVANLTRSEKPLVYFEWYKPWFSTGLGTSYDEMLVDAGGINIAENVTVANPELSPEYIVEKNPDIIIRMLTHRDGEDLAAFQTLRNDILARAGMSEVQAVKEDNVYIIKNTALVTRRPIGLLYLAKWFHPSLFEDIDPATIHKQMIQKFFGADLEGVFAYP